VGQGDPHLKIIILIGKHLKMFCFKFHQNRTINLEFDLDEVRSEGSPDLKKIRKSPIQNDGPNPHQQFQHSSSIRQCLKIGELNCEEKERRHPRFNYGNFQSAIKHKY